MSGDFQKS